MSNRYPSAVLLSTLLHGGLIALVLLLTYVVRNQIKDSPRIIELVQGDGDNFGATEAAAFGTPGAQVNVPEPAKVEPAPAPPTPAPMEAVAPPKTPTADPASKIATTLKALEEKSRKEAAKAKADEQRKAKEDAARMVTKAEFDKQNKSKAPVPAIKSGPPKVAKIDAAGIKKGVVGGSTANTIGGAGGRALVSDEGSEMEKYYALFRQRLRDELVPPPGLSDSLEARVTVTIAAGGNLSNAHVTTSSGNAEFDQSVLDAIRRMRMPVRPDHQTNPISTSIRLRDISNG